MALAVIAPDTASATCGNAADHTSMLSSGESCLVVGSGSGDLVQPVDPANPTDTIVNRLNKSGAGTASVTIRAGAGIVNTLVGASEGGGTIEGHGTGGFSLVDNAGTIVGGVMTQQAADLTISNTGLLKGAVSTSGNNTPGSAVHYTGADDSVGSGSLTITNGNSGASGTIISGANNNVSAIDTRTDGTVTIHNDNGVISGRRGVKLMEKSGGGATNGSLVLTNGTSTTAGEITATYRDAIETNVNGSVSITNTDGVIRGARRGIFVDSGTSGSLAITNEAAGTIIGGYGVTGTPDDDTNAISVMSALSGSSNTITNHGTVTGGPSRELIARGFTSALDAPAIMLDGADDANGNIRSGTGINVINDGIINGSIILGNAADQVTLTGGTLNGAVYTFVGNASGNIHVTGDASLAGSVRRFVPTENSGSLSTESFGTIAIDAGKTLTIGNSTLDTSIYATIAGSGDLRKTGTNSVLLTGHNTTTGTIRVDQGEIILDGKTAGAVQVGSSGVFRSSGIVGSLTNAGLVSVINPREVRTLYVKGDYTQSSTGTLAVKITPTSADKLSVSGTARLDGTLSVTPQSGTYVSGTTYTVVSAGAVSGTFKAVTVTDKTPLGGLALGAEYTGTEVKLVLGSSGQISALQQEESVKTVASEVTRQSSVTIGNLIGTRVASVLSPASFGRVSTPSSGGGSSSKGGGAGASAPGGVKKDDKTSMVPGTGLAAGDETSGLSGLSVWGDVGLTFLNNGRAASKYNGTHKAAVFGVDYRANDNIIVGAALSPDLANLKLSSVDGTRDTAGIGLSLYAGYRFDDTYSATAIAGYGRAFTNSEQSVGGTKVKDDYGSNRWNGRLAFSAGYVLGDALRLTPTLSYSHSIETTAKHYSSDGAEIKLPTTNIGTIGADLQLEYAVSDRVVPFLTGGVAHDVINSGGSRARTGFTAGGGVQAPIDDNLNIGAVVVGEFGRDQQTSLRIGANARFSW